jgi:thiol-disulfide isomerase/thioredoxin
MMRARPAGLAVLLGLGASLATPVRAQSAAPGFGEPQVEARLRRDEAELLHRRLELRGLRQLAGAEWKPAEAPFSRLVVVHIWAVECKPCVDEMPMLRALFAGLRKFPVLRLAFISETQDLARLKQFIDTRRAELPQTEYFQMDSDTLRRPLQNRAQPMTLLVDERGIVRQAFLGSLRARRSELTLAIERALKAL